LVHDKTTLWPCRIAAFSAYFGMVFFAPISTASLRVSPHIQPIMAVGLFLFSAACYALGILARARRE
ncbi:MAG: hypothetical protein K8R36_05345, partial [Planctomycetales bacterium]|nr:hypothetical protein [Planctomycetales bacterium]